MVCLDAAVSVLHSFSICLTIVLRMLTDTHVNAFGTTLLIWTKCYGLKKKKDNGKTDLIGACSLFSSINVFPKIVCNCDHCDFPQISQDVINFKKKKSKIKKKTKNFETFP